MYKVLHAPIEIAGQVGLICGMLKQNGIQAVGYNTFQTYLKYQRQLVETDGHELIRLFEPALRHFDIFHFHNGCSMLPDHQDIPIIHRHGKKIVMHHRGNDVRSSVLARKGRDYQNPYVYTGSSLPDQVIERNLQMFSKYVSAAIVQDHELYPYVSDYYPVVHVLPRLIDLSEKEAFYPSADCQVPKIVHAPTDRLSKGSDVIERVLKELQGQFEFEYILVQNMSHEEAMKCYREADLVIDQILVGAYGNLSIEAMALGKPVVAYIREDLKSKFPVDLPIVSANPDTLRSQLIELIANPELRNELGHRGRQYVETHHDARIVIQKLINIYENL